MGATASSVGSPEWCRALAARLEDALREPELAARRGEGTATILLGQVVTGAGPGGGDVDWLVRVLPGGGVVVEPGRAAEAPVVLVTDAAAAAELSSGTAGVSDLLAAGRVRLRGDATALVDAAPLLEALALGLAPALATSTPSPDRHASPPDSGPSTR